MPISRGGPMKTAKSSETPVGISCISGSVWVNYVCAINIRY